MGKIIIRYQKKRLNMQLIIAILFIAIFLLMVFFQKELRLSLFLYLLLTITYTYYYWLQRTKGYLQIENGVLTQFGLSFRKSINLNEVISLKEFSGSYMLKSDQTEMVIDTKLIEPESLQKLRRALSASKLIQIENE